ncbi:MAG: hypothetical protein DWQ44_11510 [Bacteroidetes bacterium]|nr:MAG: hypothetical protein DWQ33_09630 [Bacteroidota bacterium]REK05247.1 MAG: hypothetical protein DWQ39_08640 [Bacteroidota bacterium]REK32652.1 MAG: hypothetical protein DWQ44_11510 [Bacteroidota bacterium]REK48901.1 MAG: hypothetical protein DWQ48_08450 [Bacteroidota bacterium]
MIQAFASIQFFSCDFFSIILAKDEMQTNVSNVRPIAKGTAKINPEPDEEVSVDLASASALAELSMVKITPITKEDLNKNKLVCFIKQVF